MKVAQIVVGEGIYGGGVGRIASVIGEELQKKGFESMIISCKRSKGNHNSYEVKCFKFPFFSSVVFPIGLEEIIKKEKPDVIIGHGYSSTIPLFSYKIAKKLGIKHIFAVHSYPKEKGFRKLAMRLYDYLAKEAIENSKIIYFSESSKREIKKEGEIIKFKPENMFFLEKEGRDYLLFVGRLDENKRADMFVRICKKLGEKGLIVGVDEGEKQKIEKLIDELKVDVKIREAKVEEMPSIYSKAKALLSCSKYEGLPLVWLESIASQTPIFTTPVGDYKEVLRYYYGEVDPFIFNNEKEAAMKIKAFLSEIDEILLKTAQKKLKNQKFIENLIEVIKND